MKKKPMLLIIDVLPELEGIQSRIDKRSVSRFCCCTKTCCECTCQKLGLGRNTTHEKDDHFVCGDKHEPSADEW